MSILPSGLVSMVDLLILLSGVAFGCGGIALILSGAGLKRQALAKRVDLVRAPRTQRNLGPSRRAREASGTLTRPALQGLPAQQRREVARRLAPLGVPLQRASAIFMGARVLAAVAAGALAWSFLSGVALFHHSYVLLLPVALVAGFLGYAVPSVVLRWLVRRRAKAAAAGLPDALELLVVCVEAGLSLEDGIDRIIGELARSQPALAAELALTSADLKILPSRDQALANLAERVDVASVRSVVSTLSQTLRYGTPLAQAMRVVAAEMRTAALINLEERANRLPAIMTVPMMLFIMPVIFLIVGGPAILTLLDTMSRR